MFRNMVSSLLEHEKVETTHEKAREVGRLAERMITLGKRGDLHARRQALRVVRGREVQAKLFGELAERFAAPRGRLHARAAHAPARRRRGRDVDRVAARAGRRAGEAGQGEGREEAPRKKAAAAKKAAKAEKAEKAEKPAKKKAGSKKAAAKKGARKKKSSAKED